MAINTNLVVSEAGGVETVLRGGSTPTTSTSFPVAVAPDRITWTDRSGSMTTGGTSQQVMASNSTRKGWIIQNISTETMWVGIGVTAAADSTSFKLAAGDSYWEPQGNLLSTQAVNVVSATTGSKFVAKEA